MIMQQGYNMEFKLALIGGSGAYDIDPSCWGRKLEIKRISTPFGDSAPVHFYLWDERLPFAFLSRHGERGYSSTAPYVNYRANIWALKEVGVERILSWSGPGAINPDYKPGDYVIPDDLLDFTKGRPATFFTGQGLGFIRQNPVFCPQARTAMAEALEAAGAIYYQPATYACTEGPRLETPAEIRMLRILGADMVGMTIVPEVFLARELEMCYASLCYITNFAEGTRHLPYEKGVLFEGTLAKEDKTVVAEAVKNMGQLIPQTLARLSDVVRDCPCKDAMLRYRRRGDIGQDWHTWITKNND
jgi:5'-methylthioadenosine phosphorylase